MAFLLVGLLWLPACDAPGTPGAPVGGEPEVELMLGPERQPLGSLDGIDDAFSSVATVLPLDAFVGPGALGVLLPREAELRIFDAEGRLVSRIGGRGTGPGEFQSPSDAGVSGEALWIRDPARGRITVVSPSGEGLRTHPLPRDASAPQRAAWSPVGLLADERVLVRVGIPREEAEGAESEGSWPVLAWTSAPGVTAEQSGARGTADTLLQLRRAERPPPMYVGGIAIGTPRPPITADHTLLEPAWDGRSLVVVERHEEGPDPGTRVLRVLRIDLSGDTLQEYRRVVEARPLPAEMREDLPPMAGMEAFGRYLLQEEHLPVATALRVGVDGSVWVGVEGTNAQTEAWWILDEGLQPIARIRVPEGLELHQVARDRIWAVERDDLDVPFVVVHELVQGR